jgi:sugar phosphate isomerase/epimerase
MKVGLLVDITENFEEKLRHAKGLGFDLGQLACWNMDFYTEENLVALKKLLTELDFTVTDFWCGWSEPVIWSGDEKYGSLGLVPKEYRAKRLEDLKRGAKFAFDLGVMSIVSHTGYIPDNPKSEEHIGVVEALRELCTELKSRGQTFAFETGEELPYTLGKMITEIGTGNVGVNFDPANFITGGRGNPTDAMDYLGTKIHGMHAKDGVPAVFGKVEGKQTQIGEGKVDFEKLLAQLKAFGYNGDIVIEHEMYGRPDRDGDIKKAKVYLENLINKIYN